MTHMLTTSLALQKRTLLSVVSALLVVGCIGDEPKPKATLDDAGSGVEGGKGGKISVTGGDGGKISVTGGAGAGAKGGTGGAGAGAAGNTTGTGGKSGSGGAGARSGAGAGGASGAAGSPGNITTGSVCTKDEECPSDQGCTNHWCTKLCASNSDCGTAPNGRASQCLQNLGDQNTCFPGCASDQDCAIYTGARCYTLADNTTKICSIPSATGFPCSTAGDCAEAMTCVAGVWCSPATCANDQGCGKSITDVQNRCIVNQQNTSICFPGCATNADCSYFPGTSCQQNVAGEGYVCNAVSISQPCANDLDCGGQPYMCIGAPGWCSPTCQNDQDCDVSLAGYQNLCIPRKAGDSVCYPGCATDDDCKAYPNTVCDPDKTCGLKAGG